MSDDPDPKVSMCKVCKGASYVCETPGGCRFWSAALDALGAHGQGAGMIPVASLAFVLRQTEDGAAHRLSVARTRAIERATSLLMRAVEYLDEEDVEDVIPRIARDDPQAALAEEIHAWLLTREGRRA